MVEWYKKFTDRSDNEIKMFTKHNYSGRGILEALRDELYKRNGKMIPFELLPEKLKNIKRWSEVYSVIKNFGLFEYNEEGFWDMKIWNFKQCIAERKRINDEETHPTFGVINSQPPLINSQPDLCEASIGQQYRSSSPYKIRLDNKKNKQKKSNENSQIDNEENMSLKNPIAREVVDYFLLHGYTEDSALAFFRKHDPDWVNHQGHPIGNWRAYAATTFYKCQRIPEKTDKQKEILAQVEALKGKNINGVTYF